MPTPSIVPAGVGRRTLFALSVMPESMLVVDPAPNVIGADTVVLPSTFIVAARIIRDVPPIVAVPAAAALAVIVLLAVHCVGPLTTSCEPAPASEKTSSMSPSASKFAELIVNVTPALIVCVPPTALPSQSNVLTLTVVLAVTVELASIRSVPVPVSVAGPASSAPPPRIKRPVDGDVGPSLQRNRRRVERAGVHHDVARARDDHAIAGNVGSADAVLIERAGHLPFRPPSR